MVIIPKDNAYTQGIGLLEIVWNVVNAVIDTHIKTAVQFHNVLHRFRAGRGVRTATIEIKFSQEFSSVDQDPLFLVFLDPRKAYDKNTCERLLHMPAGYGAGPKIWDLLAEFWSRQEIVTLPNGYRDPQF